MRFIGSQENIQKAQETLKRAERETEEVAARNKNYLTLQLQQGLETLGSARKLKQRGAGKVQNQAIANFDNLLDRDKLEGVPVRDLVEIKLKKLQKERNKLLSKGQELARTQPEKFGYSSTEWNELIRDYLKEYENNPDFKDSPTLVRAETLIRQGRNLMDKLKPFEVV